MSTLSQLTNNNDQKNATFYFESFKQSLREMIEAKMPMAEILNAVKKKNNSKLPMVPTCAALSQLLNMPLLQVREIELWDRDENESGLINDRELNTFFEPWISKYHEIPETKTL
jgi:hypothetical protein